MNVMNRLEEYIRKNKSPDSDSKVMCLKISKLAGLFLMICGVSFVIYVVVNNHEDMSLENIVALQTSECKADCDASTEFTGTYLSGKEKFVGGGNLVITW
jgi:hypothetical protein